MTAQELSNGIPDSGHLYASVRASKMLTPAGDLQETFGGMDQVRSGDGVFVTLSYREFPHLLMFTDNEFCMPQKSTSLTDQSS